MGRASLNGVQMGQRGGSSGVCAEAPGKKQNRLAFLTLAMPRGRGLSARLLVLGARWGGPWVSIRACGNRPRGFFGLSTENEIYKKPGGRSTGPQGARLGGLVTRSACALGGKQVLQFRKGGGTGSQKE